MVTIRRLNNPEDAKQIALLLSRLTLNPADISADTGPRAKVAAAVNEILADVMARGDDAVVDWSRKLDDPQFSVDQIRITPEEMKQAAGRIPADQRDAIRRSIAQVREYQQHILPTDPPTLVRDGVELGMRFTPLTSAGLYVPGGKASYPSSFIMLAVPAMVAGVKKVVVCTTPSRYGRNDLVPAACHEIGLEHVYRATGTAAIAAMAFGTATIPRVDKIVGPGNDYIQMAKRAVSGLVGIDGYLGPSEILILADDSADAEMVAADMLAQAEHDPGSCWLLTTSQTLAEGVSAAIARQLPARQRGDAIRRSLRDQSVVIVGDDMDALIGLANAFAAEHVNLQTRDDAGVLSKLVHAGAVFCGKWSPVAAGDYIAGPSHCLPTNTTARFSSGISVYEFLKRSSVVRYEPRGIAADAPGIIALATAEHLDAHAASVEVRVRAADGKSGR